MKKLGIIGCGWTLTKNIDLLKENFQLVVSTTTAEKADAFKQKGVSSQILIIKEGLSSNVLSFLDCDALVISLPVSKTRNDEERDRVLYEGIKNFQGKIIKFSSTGVYADEEGIFDEESSVPEGLLKNAEHLFHSYFPKGIVMRLGGLMGNERNLSNFRMSLGNTDKNINYVHYADVGKALHFILQSKASQIVYNIVAPEHPLISEILNISAPEKVWKRIIHPKRLLEEGYTFLFPNPKQFAG